MPTLNCLPIVQFGQFLSNSYHLYTGISLCSHLPANSWRQVESDPYLIIAWAVTYDTAILTLCSLPLSTTAYQQFSITYVYALIHTHTLVMSQYIFLDVTKVHEYDTTQKYRVIEKLCSKFSTVYCFFFHQDVILVYLLPI